MKPIDAFQKHGHAASLQVMLKRAPGHFTPTEQIILADFADECPNDDTKKCFILGMSIFQFVENGGRVVFVDPPKKEPS